MYGVIPDLSAINIEDQSFIEFTPSFTPKNVKLGVSFYLRLNFHGNYIDLKLSIAL